ncbi:1-phosphofructokinase family hexose kinase [Varibaculum vaginae]|uniref:1-phosphofructokinase family hexose kinase n=1 Tax=Varibaculum vaginae TaxID=2364797 RepID=UPI000F082A96|nr:1-phosphofructokinase family hexose kinase [Varibaculum vaginae]
MIVTLSANSSLDKTVNLDRPLVPGGVHRIISTHTDAGGKGINVARVAQEAGFPVSCVLPAKPQDPILELLDQVELPYVCTEIPEVVRTNLTIIDAGGETTKINEPGPTLSEGHAKSLLTVLRSQVRDLGEADWVVLAGSLPPGLPDDFYLTCLKELASCRGRLAVDTSGNPLRALGKALGQVTVDLMKPNSYELAELLGGKGAELEKAAISGDLLPVVRKAKELNERGVSSVLATLGSAGAILVTAEGVWHGTSPDVPVRSTVGAGDSSLTGYVLAKSLGKSPEECLATALAYGAAACAKAGTQPPTPKEIHPEEAQITKLKL